MEKRKVKLTVDCKIYIEKKNGITQDFIDKIEEQVIKQINESISFEETGSSFFEDKDKEYLFEFTASDIEIEIDEEVPFISPGCYLSEEQFKTWKIENK